MQMSNHCSQIMMLRSKLKTKLDPMRYEHSLSVSFTCMNLAMRYGYDIDKAELAGLTHLPLLPLSVQSWGWRDFFCLCGRSSLHFSHPFLQMQRLPPSAILKVWLEYNWPHHPVLQRSDQNTDIYHSYNPAWNPWY